MGEVYLAEDSRLGRRVAVKILIPESLSDARANKRLIREAQAAASLDHPNICAVHEAGEENGYSFIVMQYIEGETLDCRILREPLKLREAVGLAVQVAGALAEAHSHGVVHRDIKPQNIMVNTRGHVKVLDFGLAKVAPGGQDIDREAATQTMLTEPGMMIGTVPYMSPEQIREEELDERSDIFSFGTVLYEMISGRHPFTRGSRGALISDILTHEPPPLSLHIADVPAEGERIIRKCIRKDRDRRYQSARELLADLSDLLRGIETDSVITKSDATPRHGYRDFVYQGLALVLLFFVGLGLYSFFNRDEPSVINSLAVLPFVSVGGDNVEMEYLSEGITESVINSLSQLPGVKIIAHSSTSAYRGRDANPQEVGRALGVAALLTGRIVKRGDGFSVSAELVDARDSRRIWGEKFNRDSSNLVGIEEDISREVTGRLGLRSSGGQEEKAASKHHGTNNEAYLLYIKGRYYLNKRHTDDVKKAIEYFRQATDIDPTYAQAWAGLADAYATLGSGGYDPRRPREMMPKARAAAEKALEIDDRLGEAHASLGIIKLKYDWDWPGAESSLKRATELTPNNATAQYWYSRYLTYAGRHNEAVEESRKARELDPISAFTGANVGRALYFAREYDRAIEESRKASEIDPKYPTPYVITGLSYLQKGMYEEAITEFQKVARLSGDAAYSTPLIGYAYAVSHREGKAREIIKDLARLSKSRYVPPDDVAVVHSGLGEKDQAFEWLNKAYEERAAWLIALKVEPLFDPLRGDPRYAELVGRIGLEP
ncbi:MAG: protein kinase [Rubrivivax sp.]|nr:protein kinase [Pyrinomonadaceae bacterium]